MASKIILKKSSVAAKAPVAGDLDFGELAINYTDSKLYFKKADGNIDAFTTAVAAVTSVGGNTGAITDTQLLTSIKSVDGTGSGLDADLLDGNHASDFYLASNPNGYTSNTGTVTSVGATTPLVSSGGNTPSISIPAATASANGYMSSAYAAKLDGIAAGAQVNVATNLGYTASTRVLTSSTGTSVTLPQVTTSADGLMIAADKTKLNGIATGATANTGTVTSIATSGSVNGLTLTGGTITTTGTITLGGTLSASIDNITDKARLFNNMGGNHSTNTDFNAVADFGARFIQAGTNGPTGVGANQFYGFTLGLGNEYALGNYASQFYWPRAAQNADTYIYVRDREGGTWGSWRKTKAGYADTAGSATDNTKLPLTGGSLTGPLNVNRRRLSFSSSYNDPNHSIYNNNEDIDSEGVWDGMKMNVYNGLQVRTGNASGVIPTLNFAVYNGEGVHIPSAFTMGSRSNSSNFGGNTAGMSGNSFVAEVRANGAKPTLTFHYEDVATTHLEHLSDGSLNVWRPSGEGTSVFKIGNNVTLHAGNYTTYSPSLTGTGASGTWGISITGNAASITNQANSATITASTGVTGSHIVQRDANGYIYANHINFNTTEYENPTISSFITSNGDGWSRKSSLVHVKNQIRGVADGTWGINITGTAGGETLATVTSRGASTGTALTLSSGGNQYNGHFYYLPYDSAGNHYPHFNDGGSASGSKVNWRLFTGGTNSVTHYWDTSTALFNTKLESSSRVDAPIFYDRNDTSYYVDPNSNSRLLHIFAGNVASSNDGGWNARMNLVGSSHARLDVVSNSDGIVTTMYSHTGQGVGKVGTYSNHPLVLMAQGATEGGSVYAGSLRSPIFYDSNDTAYYANPNETSNLSRVTLTNGNLALTQGDGTGLRITTAYGYINFGAQNTSWTHVYADRPFYTNQDWYVNGNLIHHDGNAGRSRNSNLMYYQGFTLDANTMDTNATGFTYSNNAPATGPIARFSTGGGYDLWLNAAYNGGGNTLYFRTRNGDAGSINSWKALVSYGVNYGDSIYASIYYDANDTGYYVDPNSSSRLNETYTSNSYTYGWFRTYDNNGLYNQTHGNHWYATGNDYWNLAGNNTTNVGIILRTGGHQGTSRGYVYADNSNNIGFLNNAGSWRLRVVAGDYSLADGSSMRAQLYYDSNNTGYYADLNGTTYLYYLQSATTVRADSDRRLKENITPITSALSLVRQLQGCRYTRNDLADKTKVYIGMIAQDVLPIVPEVVSGSEAGKYSLGYAELVPVLNEAVKELDEIVSKQAAIIAKLEERLSKLLGD